MNKVLFYLIMLPSGLWKSMGADVVQLRAILGVRLKLDDRKPLTFGRKQKKPSKFNSGVQAMLSFFIGIMYILPLIAFKDNIMGLFGYYTTFIFLLTFSLITDYANVMVDTRDKHIILPRPVDGQTLFLSKTLHLFIYLFRTVLPMALPGWVLLGFTLGWKAALLFPLPLLLMVFITLFLVNACYLLIVRFAGAGNFQRVLGTFQIVFTVLIIAFYYLLQGAMTSSFVKEFDIAQHGWIRIAPSYWLASMFTWVGFDAVLPGTIWLSIVAIVFPFLCLWITVTRFAPKFTAKLGGIDSDSNAQMAPVVKGKKIVKRTYHKLANMFNRSDAAKAGFMITWIQTARSRSFRMKLYPSLVTVPLYFVFLLSMGNEKLVDKFHQLPDTKKHLLLLYMSAFALLNGMHYLLRSEQYKAAWVYYSAPLQTPGHVLAGAFKALWLKYYLPFITFIACFVISVWGLPAILDVVLATVNVTFFSLSLMYVGARAFPFSIMEQENKKDSIIRVFASFLLIGILGFSHYLVYFWWLKLLLIVLSAIFSWVVWDSYKDTSWEKIKIAEETT